MFFLVCFDISDDRIRYRTVKVLKGFGKRVQKSVFECGGLGECADGRITGRDGDGGNAIVLVGQYSDTAVNGGIYLDIGDVVGRAAAGIFDDNGKARNRLDIYPVNQGCKAVIHCDSGGCFCY